MPACHIFLPPVAPQDDAEPVAPLADDEPVAPLDKEHLVQLPLVQLGDDNTLPLLDDNEPLLAPLDDDKPLVQHEEPLTLLEEHELFEEHELLHD